VARASTFTAAGTTAKKKVSKAELKEQARVAEVVHCLANKHRKGVPSEKDLGDEIEVLFDPGFAGLSGEFSAALAGFRAGGVFPHVGCSARLAVPGSVRWQRRDRYFGVPVESIRINSAFVQPENPFTELTLLPRQAEGLARENVEAALQAVAAAWPGGRVVLLVHGADRLVGPEYVALRHAVLRLTLGGVFVRNARTVEDMVSVLYSLTAAIARAPYVDEDPVLDACTVIASSAKPSYERLGVENVRHPDYATRPLRTAYWCIALSSIHGCGSEAVTAIARVYPTLRSLHRAYEALPSDNERALLLKDLTPDHGGGRRLGPVLSARIFRLLTGRRPDCII
jgi:hypothetical protein